MWKFRHVIRRKTNQVRWIRIPSEISRFRKDLWEDLEYETLDMGRSMIQEPGLDIIFWWENVDWESGSGLRFLPESICYLPKQHPTVQESRIELSFEALSENYFQDNQSRDLQNRTQL